MMVDKLVTYVVNMCEAALNIFEQGPFQHVMAKELFTKKRIASSTVHWKTSSSAQAQACFSITTVTAQSVTFDSHKKASTVILNDGSLCYPTTQPKKNISTILSRDA